MFVNAYAITQEYGGPEEGDWYYLQYRLLESVACSTEEEAEHTQALLEVQYADKKYGNIYSARGGQELEVLIEEEAGESETRDTPFYE